MLDLSTTRLSTLLIAYNRWIGGVYLHSDKKYKATQATL